MKELLLNILTFFVLIGMLSVIRDIVKLVGDRGNER